MKNYTQCPVCEKTNFLTFLECKDYTVSKETYSIVQCKNCHFVFTNPIPEESEIGKFYESEDYISHSNTKKGIVSSLYQKVRNYTLSEKVALLKRLSQDKNILDVGAGTGEFLNTCKLNGFSVEGIEPSEKAREQALKNYNIQLKTESAFDSLPDNSFDFISMWHVLEHVYHLNHRVKELYRVLSNDGHLIIAVPNYTSYDAKHYGKYWAAYDVPRHLYHFSPDTITQLMKKHGFDLKETLPMKFDSFYVSMLSEKYKTGKVNLVSAFINGLKSNLKANPEKTFSSQIYIFKKKIN